MILGLKRRIISRFLQCPRLLLTEEPNFQEIQQRTEDCISFCRVKKNKPRNRNFLQFRLDFLEHASLGSIDLFKIRANSEVSEVTDRIFFRLNPSVLAETVLTDIYEQAENYGKNQAMEFKQFFNGKSFVDIPKNENVVVELSNKSIANPFHVSHLKNIMIGRFITNISKLFNKNVTFVNYLQDWVEMANALVYKKYEYPYKYKEDDLFHLLDLADVFKEIPRKYFDDETMYKICEQLATFMKSLEQGDKKALEIWQKCRDVYVNDHEKMYQRLGIKFDVTYAESQYKKRQANQIISLAEEKNLLQVNKKTGALYIDVSEDGDKNPWCIDFRNSSYIGICFPRVIAAVFDRFDTYSADRIIYVMNSNTSYFKSLQRIAKKLRPDQPGRIEYALTGDMPPYGIKSPKLSNMLDEFINSKTAIMLKHKLWEDNESLRDVTDKLSICQFAMKNLVEMKFLSTRKRNVHESFGGHENAALQHSHVRLCRLIKLYNDDYSFKSIDFNLLSEKCAIRLIQHLASYHEVLIKSYMELQSNHLVHYLVTLMKLEHIAYKELLLFNQPKETRDARLTLFICTRQVLANGMNILGIQPLGKI